MCRTPTLSDAYHTSRHVLMYICYYIMHCTCISCIVILTTHSSPLPLFSSLVTLLFYFIHFFCFLVFSSPFSFTSAFSWPNCYFFLVPNLSGVFRPVVCISHTLCHPLFICYSNQVCLCCNLHVLFIIFFFTLSFVCCFISLSLLTLCQSSC